MTTIETHAPGPAADVGAAVAPPGELGATAVSRPPSQVVAWITSTDHKRIGRMFVGVGLTGLFGVAVLGVLLGIDRVANTSNVLGANSVAQVFAAYRVGLVYIVVAPLLVGIAIGAVPLQVGARSLALPRLAAAGFWLWLVGSLLGIGAIAANGGPNGGDRRMVAGFLVAQIVALIGLLAAATSVAVTVLTTRAPGMNMRRVPPFSFAALVSALGMVIALPVVIGALVYSFVDYRYGGAGFGQSHDLWSHIGFGYAGPIMVVLALPAFGVAVDTLAVASRRRLPMRGVVLSGFGLLGVAALATATQVSANVRADFFHGSFGRALNDLVPFALLDLLPVLGGLIVLGLGGLALSTGKPKVIGPFVAALLGAAMVFAGLLANAVSLIGDAHLSGTVFDEGVRLLVGYGAVLAALGGVAYWAPKWWGPRLPDGAVLGLAALGFVATAAAALPLLVAGFAKQPADSVEFSYGGPDKLWNVISLGGHALMLLTVVAFVGLLAKSVAGGGSAAAGDDPWDGQTLEWATSSPAPVANFADVPVVASAEPLMDLKPAAEGTI